MSLPNHTPTVFIWHRYSITWFSSWPELYFSTDDSDFLTIVTCCLCALIITSALLVYGSFKVSFDTWDPTDFYALLPSLNHLPIEKLSSSKLYLICRISGGTWSHGLLLLWWSSSSNWWYFSTSFTSWTQRARKLLTNRFSIQPSKYFA